MSGNVRTDDDNDDDSLGDDAVAPIVMIYSWRVLLFALKINAASFAQLFFNYRLTFLLFGCLIYFLLLERA